MPAADRLRPFPIRDLRIEGGLVGERRGAIFDRGLLAQLRQIERTGRLENFRRVARSERGTHEGRYFNDSDVYKWLEACSYALASDPSHPIGSHAESAIETIAAAQDETGYLNTFFQLNHPELRWRNLGAMHEMYCGGHLIEAGVAHREATGSNRLYDVAERFADHVADTFGPAKRRGFCGHEGIEIALIRLSDSAGSPRYRELAAWMIEQRGRRPSIFEAELADAAAQTLSPWMAGLLRGDGDYSGQYLQDHLPLQEHDEVVGHAVRAMYLYAAAASVAEGHEGWMEALARCWNNLTERRMYVTGGIGPSAHNEGFTADFDLPNRTAYAETCAAVGLVLWGNEMLRATGDGSYADVMERAFFNGALGGVSLDAERYFYTNPLESHGEHERVGWFDCACCPPNIARLLGRSGTFVAGFGIAEDSKGPPTVCVHIPISFRASLAAAGIRGTMVCDSNYPWIGDVEVRFELEAPVDFELRVRIPAWCQDCKIDSGSVEEPAQYDRGYAVLARRWKSGDRIRVAYRMPARWLESDPGVLDNAGRVALTKGPIVFCLEEADLQAPPQRFVADIRKEVRECAAPGALGGAIALRCDGLLDHRCESVAEAFPAAECRPASAAEATLVPYFAWNNRGANRMLVWLRSS